MRPPWLWDGDMLPVEDGGWGLLHPPAGVWAVETLPSHHCAMWQEQRWAGDMARMGRDCPLTQQVCGGGCWFSSSEMTNPGKEGTAGPRTVLGGLQVKVC